MIRDGSRDLKRPVASDEGHHPIKQLLVFLIEPGST